MPEVTLRDITDDNWMQAARIEHAPEQAGFVAGPMEILALAYVGRHRNARAQAICAQDKLVGLLLVEDLAQEPVCYHLHELLVDRRHQGQGYGSRAMQLLMEELRREGKFPRVEVCVHRQNTNAIEFFQRNGFVLTDYIDPDHAWDRSMVYTLVPAQANTVPYAH